MGEVDQALARRYERQCLGGLIAFDRQEATLEDVLPRLLEYDQLFDGRSDKTEVYREVLEDQPWKRCPCAVCRTIGVHVVIFRGAERNRRRGFHNLYVLHQKVEGILETISESASI